MTDEETFGELRRLDELATPGPWRQGKHEKFNVFVQSRDGIGPERVLLRMNVHYQHDIDAALIAAMRNALPMLLEKASAFRAAYNIGIDRQKDLGVLRQMLKCELDANVALNAQVTELQSDSTTLCEVRRALGLPMGATPAELIAEATRVSRGTQPAEDGRA